MFGYVRPHVPELKMYQYEIYKSAYCGLCSTAGKTVSFFSRFFLSYDFAFMVIMHLLFTGGEYTIEKKSCPFKPYKKHPEMKSNSSLNYCAAAFSLFTYYKVADSMYDSKGFKKLFFKLLLFFIKGFKDKPKLQYPSLCRSIEENLFLLWQEEKNPSATLDSVSHYFGLLAKAVVAKGACDDVKNIAQDCSYQLGRFIYMADAADDIEEDFKNGRFNPLLLMFGNVSEAKKYVRENMDLLMYGLNLSAKNLKDKYKESNKNISSLCDICVNTLSFGCLFSLKKVVSGKENTKNSH